MKNQTRLPSGFSRDALQESIRLAESKGIERSMYEAWAECTPVTAHATSHQAHNGPAACAGGPLDPIRPPGQPFLAPVRELSTTGLEILVEGALPAELPVLVRLIHPDATVAVEHRCVIRDCRACPVTGWRCCHLEFLPRSAWDEPID